MCSSYYVISGGDNGGSNSSINSASQESSTSATSDLYSMDQTSSQSTLKKHVSTETWSSTGDDIDQSNRLVSPKLLKQQILNEDDNWKSHHLTNGGNTISKGMGHSYQEEEYIYEPKLNGSSTRLVTRCRSLLNLELHPSDDSAETRTTLASKPPAPCQLIPTSFNLSKTVSEQNLHSKDTHQSSLGTGNEKERITKTIGIMLEKRRKQAAELIHVLSKPSKSASISGTNSGATDTNRSQSKNPTKSTKKQDTTNHSSKLNQLLLTNDNVELVEHRRAHTLERSCRVTGEILKGIRNGAAGVIANIGGGRIDHRDHRDHHQVFTLPRTNAAKSHGSLQRHFYYPLHACKSTSRIRDDELPDPDKVKSARQVFEKVLTDMRQKQVSLNSSPAAVAKATTPPNQIGKTGTTGASITNRHHSKLQKCLSADTASLVVISPPQQRRRLLHKWVDSGSQSSSGVSDGSGVDLDTDADEKILQKRKITSKSCKTAGSDSGGGVFSSDDDSSSDSSNGGLRRRSLDNISDPDNEAPLGKPISQEVLDNIRAFGTSVTYCGGKIVACSRGCSYSPMTMTIMNEIKEGAGPDYSVNGSRVRNGAGNPALLDKCVSKFRLVKSNSCGSRLELSDTDEYGREYERRLAALKRPEGAAAASSSGGNSPDQHDQSLSAASRRQLVTPHTITEEEEPGPENAPSAVLKTAIIREVKELLMECNNVEICERLPPLQKLPDVPKMRTVQRQQINGGGSRSRVRSRQMEPPALKTDPGLGAVASGAANGPPAFCEMEFESFEVRDDGKNKSTHQPV